MGHAIPVLQESAAEPKGEDHRLSRADEDRSWAESWETIGLKYIYRGLSHSHIFALARMGLCPRMTWRHKPRRWGRAINNFKTTKSFQIKKE